MNHKSHFFAKLVHGTNFLQYSCKISQKMPLSYKMPFEKIVPYSSLLQLKITTKILRVDLELIRVDLWIHEISKKIVDLRFKISKNIINLGSKIRKKMNIK